MKTIVILDDFEGFPQGETQPNPNHDPKRKDDPRYAERIARRAEMFLAGTEREVSDSFADLIIGKGLAKLKAAPVAPVADDKDDAAEKAAPKAKK